MQALLLLVANRNLPELRSGYPNEVRVFSETFALAKAIRVTLTLAKLELAKLELAKLELAKLALRARPSGVRPSAE